MSRPEIAAETIVLERPREEEPPCSVRNGLQDASRSFDEWIQGTLWYVAAP